MYGSEVFEGLTRRFQCSVDFGKAQTRVGALIQRLSGFKPPDSLLGALGGGLGAGTDMAEGAWLETLSQEAIAQARSAYPESSMRLFGFRNCRLIDAEGRPLPNFSPDSGPLSAQNDDKLRVSIEFGCYPAVELLEDLSAVELPRFVATNSEKLVRKSLAKVRKIGSKFIPTLEPIGQTDRVIVEYKWMDTPFVMPPSHPVTLDMDVDGESEMARSLMGLKAGSRLGAKFRLNAVLQSAANIDSAEPLDFSVEIHVLGVFKCIEPDAADIVDESLERMIRDHVASEIEDRLNRFFRQKAFDTLLGRYCRIHWDNGILEDEFEKYLRSAYSKIRYGVGGAGFEDFRSRINGEHYLEAFKRELAEASLTRDLAHLMDIEFADDEVDLFLHEFARKTGKMEIQGALSSNPLVRKACARVMISEELIGRLTAICKFEPHDIDADYLIGLDIKNELETLLADP